MTQPNPDPTYKADLVRYLQESREALLWKLDGLSEYDARRPLTPTGTNLLGLVKHLSGVELGYFGDTFGRPYFTEEKPPPSWWWTEAEDPHADMYATPEESREEITGLYRRAWEHAQATFDALPWTRWAVFRGGPRSGARSRCTTSWCGSTPTPSATRATPTSSANSSTERPG